jgi:hypothetical protein
MGLDEFSLGHRGHCDSCDAVSPVAACQSLFVLKGDFVPRGVAEIRSPDGRLRLHVTTRATFPVVDFLDPAGVVYFKLVDAGSGDLVAQTHALVWEFDDVRAPALQWSPSEVVVSDFEPGEPNNIVRLLFHPTVQQ